jgi:fatty acid synthase
MFCWQNCLQGLEFSGRNVKGQRVMGMCNYGAMSTMVMADNDFLWNVPEHWTLEEAATVPVVYSTVS